MCEAVVSGLILLRLTGTTADWKSAAAANLELLFVIRGPGDWPMCHYDEG